MELSKLSYDPQSHLWTLYNDNNEPVVTSPYSDMAWAVKK